ncbi:alpha/beta fold hydrolase [Arcobacter sp. CECT 8985]|uniref:alpha/beta fold hydrolase n=1 Tax=Arcobacter sp. CECT 8985 TaxID=1935424 RepID=UPI00100B4EDA|nr:alpha/beta hydrolase [Arcobacter sp. CECT 8985]RXJ88242.1 hypothetical protein CRU93_01195 [Arcobacter sp. CECT 8985]
MTKRRVYLITGFMCDQRVWNKVLSLFDNSFEFIHIHISIENSIEKIVEKINIEDENIILVGFSLGGYIASYYALKNQFKVNKVLVISSSLCSLNHKEIKQRENALKLTREYGFSIINDKKIKTLLENKNDESLIFLIKDMYKKNSKDIFLNLLEATTYRNDLSKKINSTNIDFNFLYSKDDILINKKWIYELKKSTNFNFFELNSSSHIIPLEKPHITKSIIENLF